MNTNIINEFEKLIAFYQKDAIANKFRISQLSNVLRLLKKYPKEIKLDNYKELIDVGGIGKSSIDRIKEILEEGKLGIVEKFVDTNKKKREIIEELEEIIGVGKANASELYNNGVHSVKDLKEKIKNKEIVVNDKILLGLKYYGKYQMNIPRSEMNKYNTFFQQFIKKINKTIKATDSDKYIVEICGSYRREKPTSNDIDVLISKIGTTSKSKKYNHLERIVNRLKTPIKINNNKPLLVDSMTDKKVKTKYMGFSKLNDNYIRRIDIRFITHDSYPAALLYFTGSGDLNKKMRNIARSKGYKLSEYGLFDKNNEHIHITSERDIFRKLDMEYLPPRLR